MNNHYKQIFTIHKKYFQFCDPSTFILSKTRI